MTRTKQAVVWISASFTLIVADVLLRLAFNGDYPFADVVSGTGWGCLAVGTYHTGWAQCQRFLHREVSNRE